MNNYGINSYLNTINQTTNSASNSSGLSNGALNAVALGGSVAGDVISGEVVSVNGKTVQIQMENRGVITARVENDMDVSVGQSLAFEVKSNSNGHISLSPLFTNTTMNPAMIKAITQAGLLLSEQSISMTSAMMDNAMGIDRQSMQKMFALINEHPNADPENLVSMKVLGIPITEDNIEQFEIYKNNEHQIFNLAEDISEGILDVSKELDLSSNNELLQALNGKADTSVFVADAINTNEALSEVADSKLEQNQPEVNYVGPFGASFADKESKAGESIDSEINSEYEGVSQNVSSLSDKLVQVGTDTDLKDETELTRLMPAADRTQLAEELLKMGLPEDKAIQIVDGEVSPKELMNIVQAGIQISESGAGDKEAAKNIINSSGFKTLFKDLLKNQWSLKSYDDFSKTGIDKLYQKIAQDTEKILNVLNSAGKGESTAAASCKQLQQNLSFMNDLNQICQYVQLPVKLSQNDAHADLFVYTNKKKLSLDDGEVSALLHLEMKTLGTMDIHVSMKDVEHVNTHFYLEDEQMLDFVEKNLPSLDERLKERGYTMHSVASKKDTTSVTENEATNKSVATMLGLDKHKMLSKYSFDMRA